MSPFVFKRTNQFRIRILLSLTMLFLAGVLLGGCSDEATSKHRGDQFSMYGAGDDASGGGRGAPLQHYTETGKSIEVAVVWNSVAMAGTNFWEGADLAVEEINSVQNPSFPKLKINRVDSAPYLKRYGVAKNADGRYRNASQIAAAALAEDVLENRNNVAVIGHAFGENTATSALLQYERKGILFLSSASVDKRFSSLRAPLAFQLFPNLDLIATRVAEFGERAKIDYLIIIHQRGMYQTQEDPIPAFRKQLAAHSIDLVDVVSFKGLSNNTRTVAKITQELVTKMRTAGPNVGLLLLVEHQLAGLIFEQLSVLKLTPPMLAASRMNIFEEHNKDMYPGFTYLDIYSKDRSFLAQRFYQSFKTRYPDLRPTNYAALGYDHIRLLYQALLCAGTTDPGSVALTMRYNLPKWHGASGAYDFNQAFSNKGRNLIFRQFKETKGELEIVTLDF